MRMNYLTWWGIINEIIKLYRGDFYAVCQIAENAGLLKYKIYQEKLNCVLFAPKEIKKYATNNGNASKELMEQFFIQETNIRLKKILNQPEKQWNPSSDIIDSYYIAKYGIEKIIFW